MNELTRMKQAKVLLLETLLFYGIVMAPVELVESNDIPTATTNGDWIKFNPKFTKTLDLKQLITLCAHESFHISDAHHFRILGRDPKTWNEATDYVINDRLVQEGFKRIPGMLWNPKFRDWSSERVYNYLKKNPQEVQGNRIGDVEEGKLKQGESVQEKIEDIKETVKNASRMAKKAGKLSGSLEKHIERMFKPQISWEYYIRRFFQAISKQDYSWTRPNKYFKHIRMPGLDSEELGLILIAIDTSGSVWSQQHLLEKFISEINGLRLQYKFNTEVICADTNVKWSKRFNKYEDTNVILKGGGGTKFSPTFSWIQNNIHEPIAGLLYFTDLTCYDFGPRPYYPVLWVNYGRERKVPFGETIRIER